MYPDEVSGLNRWFRSLVLVAQLLGLLAVALVAIWMGHFQGPFAWTSNPSKEFNYHPLFMTIGMIYLYGNAILVFRVCRDTRKKTVKVLHGVLQLLALVFAIVALKAVFDSHNLKTPPAANMFSLHSWLGITTVVCFTSQWALGFVSFLFPGLSMAFRSGYKPVHVFFGGAIFALAIASAVTGIQEKTGAVPNYHLLPAEGVLCNMFGLCVVSFGVTVIYIVSRSSFARVASQEETHLQLAE